VICDLGVAAMESGDANTGEVQSLNLDGEDLRSDLNWLCLSITLLKALFCKHILSPR
jgi:hypothetical protein